MSKLANGNGCCFPIRSLARIFPSPSEVKHWRSSGSLCAKMPRGRKRKKEDHSDSGRDEAAQEEKDESSDETSSVKKKKESPKSLTFKIEHW